MVNNMFEKCDYIISAVKKNQFPNINKYPEFVFLGRSNVGKSSFINSLTNRKNLARTSSKPGKTIAINFFEIDNSFYFVDVPGYGYASHGKETRLDFGKYIEEYLVDNPCLKIAFLLVDTKVGPTKDDKLMFDYLKYLNLNICVVGTKCDKVGTTKLASQTKLIANDLMISKDKIILTSSQTKCGFDKIINLIKEAL